MKKLLLSLMAVATLGVVQAKKVKFQVDMTGQTISANGVHVAGNFQAAAGAPNDWSPSATALSNGGSGNIYSVVVDIPAKAVYEYKFINDNDWAGEEQIPAVSKMESPANGGSNGNRWIYIDSLANDTTILPAILFGGSAPAGKVAVRFAVDLQTQPSVDANGVHIAGNFQAANGASADWKPNETRMTALFPQSVANGKVYEYIAYIDPSSTIEFKYLNGNDWPFNESVPSTCQVGGGNQNRHYTSALASAALDKVCFGSCVACPTAPVPMYSLAFIVDMSNSDCDGGFDSVTVAGAGARLTSFGAGIRMMEIGSSKMFAVVVDSLDSGEVEYKFRKHKDGNTGWEDGSNRIFALSANDSVDLTCFGSRTVGACATKPAPSSITFKVDMTNETPGVVYVMGTFQTPNWQGGALRMSPSAGQPGVFEVTVNNVCPGSFNYKFINGDSSVSANEENFPDADHRACVESNGQGGFNRMYTRTVATPVTLYYVYNTCTLGSNVGLNEVALSSTFKLFPNPAQSYTMIEFNDKAAKHNVVVMDIAGKVVQSYNDYSQNTLMINTEELSKGIYFIKASNTRNESVTSKLIVR